ncbi:MAG: type II toxin-antitoxin system VapB family antitoxin [Vulcanimicrobiota bacterium]
MALNIKNSRTEELARQVALETGENLTTAVTVALEERLERLRGRRRTPDLRQVLNEISQRCAALPDLDARSTDEILGYDDVGGFDDDY